MVSHLASRIVGRGYQCAARDAILGDFDSGVNKSLVVMATGTGKTVLFSMVGDARDWGRVLVIAERREIIAQAQDKIHRVTGDKPDIEMADEYATTNKSLWARPSKYVCASIQTISKRRRFNRFDWSEFGLVIIDEAHHSRASSYERVIREISEKNPAAKFLGVTATADRGDKKSLGPIYEKVSFRYEINSAINDGYLVPVHQRFAEIKGLDFSEVSTRGGDLDTNELSAILRDDGGQVPHKIASSIVDAAVDEQAVVFTCDVAQAYQSAAIIERMGKKAVAMDGTWDTDRRKQVLAAYSRGEFQFLVNCALFTEGWDEPRVSVVGIARPTKSRQLYTQMVGRGLRPWCPSPGWSIDAGTETPEDRAGKIAASGKPRCLVIDLVGNSGKHKLVCTADLLGGSHEPTVVARAKARAKKNADTDFAKILDEEKERLASERAEADARRERQKSKIWARASVRYFDVDPFSGIDSDQGHNGVERGGRLASSKQVEFLRKQKIDARGMSFEEAQGIIKEVFARASRGRCSVAQKSLLSSFGVSSDGLTYKSASAMIDFVRACGWRHPGEIKKSDLSIRSVDGGYRLVYDSCIGKVQVGKPMPSIDSIREYGSLVAK